MSSNTYIIHSGIGVEGFPFDGIWESAGAGYAGGQISDLENTGTITPSNTFNGFDLYAIGVVTGSGYSANGVNSPVFCVVMDSGTPQNVFTSITVQLNVACSSPYTFDSASANLYTNQPASGPASANWVWTIPNASLLFVHNEDTTVTFDYAPPLESCVDLTITPVSDSEIDLTWTNSDADVIFFNVSIDEVVVAQLANTVFEYDATGLTPSTSYDFSITPVDASNNAVCLTTSGSGSTEDPPVPLPVQFLSAFNGDQFFTANGDLNIGGELFTYSEGSLTPVTTYTDVTGTVENPNPLVINTDGYLDTEIWTIPGTNTRVQIYDVNSVLLQDLDNIPGVPYLGTSGGNEVFVIDSIFSTDTANASSANATNWVYKIANAAYGQANTDANAISNLISNVAQLTTNTIIIQSHGVTINIGNSVNFINTAFANIAVTPFGPDAVNVAIFANGTTSGNTTSNSSVTINGIIFQWAFYSHTVAGEAGPFTDDFPAAFPNACLSVQMTTQGGPGAVGLVVSTFTKSALTWYSAFGGADSTGQYVLAIGY